MRRIGGAASIAANEQFVSTAQTLLDQVCGFRELRIEMK
jgi:hypothetical protein